VTGLTFGGVLHAPYVPPAVRAPLVVSQTVTDDSVPGTRDMPSTARTWLLSAIAHGWRTHVTYALGWMVDGSGEEVVTLVREQTGNDTPTGRAAMRVSARVPRDAVPSYLVRAGRGRPTQFFAAGLWVDGKWEHGFTRVHGEPLHFHPTAKAVREFMGEVNSHHQSERNMPPRQLSLDDLA
jgi:hypothetical protein